MAIRLKNDIPSLLKSTLQLGKVVQYGNDLLPTFVAPLHWIVSLEIHAFFLHIKWF
jgi:hypothetical protein